MPRVKGRFDLLVLTQRRFRDLYSQEHIFRPRMRGLVEIGVGAQQGDVGLGFGMVVEN